MASRSFPRARPSDAPIVPHRPARAPAPTDQRRRQTHRLACGADASETKRLGREACFAGCEAYFVCAEDSSRLSNEVPDANRPVRLEVVVLWQVASQTRREEARNARRTFCTLSIAGDRATK